MKIEVKDVIETTARGNIVFVSDYRKPDLNQKAIRNVSPEKVLVCTEEDFVAAGKKYPNVNYSNTVLVPLNKKGLPVWSRPIKVFDNTGYRYNTGVAVNIFDNMKECVQSFNEQVQSVIERYHEAILNAPKYLIAEQLEIKKLLVKDDE